MKVDKQAVAELWSAVLGVVDPPQEQLFVAVGGQSIDAARLAMAIQHHLGVVVALSDIFGCRDLAGLTDLVLRTTRGERRLPGLAEVGPAPAGLVSLQTERKLAIEKTHPLAARRIVSIAFRLRGALDVAALGRAVADLGRRHTVLVSRFVDSPSGTRLLQDPDAILRLEQLAATDSGSGEDWAPTEVDRVCDRPFALATGPLARAVLITASPIDSVLVLSVQHYIFDGWSLKVALRDLADAYDAHRSGYQWQPAPLAASHVDFAHWQRTVLAGDYRHHLISFWEEYLAGAQLDVRVNGMIGVDFGSHGGKVAVEVEADAADRWREFARAEGVTLFALMLAGLTVAIRELGGPSDIAAHTSIANRRLAEFEDVVGYFSHGLIIRNHVAPEQSFKDVVGAVFESCRIAYQHQDLPYSELIRSLWPDLYAAGPSLETVYFDVYNDADTRLRLGDASAERLDRVQTTADPGINAFVTNHAEGESMVLELLHNFDSVDAELARVILGAWRSALERGIAAPLQSVGQFFSPSPS